MPPAPNLARAAFSQGSRIVKVRRSTGALIDGRWVVSGDHDSTIHAAVRPITPSLRKLLPEGRRTEDSITLLTRKTLTVERTSAGGAASPDRVFYDGWWWEVVGEKSWKENGFYRYVAVRETKGGESNR